MERGTAYFLAQDGSVVPGETEFRIGRESPEHTQCLRTAGIIVEKHIPLFPFDERENIDLTGLR